jgi:oligopeptide transport system substrate-binding protein
MRLSFAALCVAALVAGCSKPKEIRSKQELRLNIHSEPPTLDPRKGTDTTSIAVVNMCFEGLAKPGIYGEPTLALATSVVASEDQTKYTFTLRPAKWSDGTPLTAYNFEESWKTILDPAFPCQFASDLYALKNGKAAKEKKCPLSDVGVEAIDSQTLVVHLEHPTPYFLELAASHSFLPAPSHITASHPDWAENAGEHFVCNGPFKLTSWKHYNEIIVEKNLHYWDAQQVKLDQIHLSIIQDENTELSMFENDELDWAGHPLSALPSDAIQTLARKYALHTKPIAGTYYYIFNVKVPPFNNANVRRAFSLAIDRKSIVENITQNKQQVATGIVPPLLWKEVAPIYFKDNDLQEAKRLFALGMEELGMSVDDFPSITLSYNTTEAHHKIAQAIQEQWFDAFGVRVHLANKEWKVFLSELQKHQFQIARLGGIASISDPIDFLQNYKTISRVNYPQWSNPKFTALLEEAERTSEQKKRLSLLREAEALFISEMPIAPIYYYTSSYLKKPYVKGITVSELGDIDFKSAYLEHE